MRRQIEDLKRKAEQGSQKLQGDVQELELEKALRERFPRDQIESVKSGVRGADVLQKVMSDSGQTLRNHSLGIETGPQLERQMDR